MKFKLILWKKKMQISYMLDGNKKMKEQMEKLENDYQNLLLINEESKTNYDELLSKHNELLDKYDELNKENKNIKN